MCVSFCTVGSMCVSSRPRFSADDVISYVCVCLWMSITSLIPLAAREAEMLRLQRHRRHHRTQRLCPHPPMATHTPPLSPTNHVLIRICLQVAKYTPWWQVFVVTLGHHRLILKQHDAASNHFNGTLTNRENGASITDALGPSWLSVDLTASPKP